MFCRISKIKIVSLGVFLLFLLYPVFVSAANGTIDSVEKYAWGDYIGWVNFGCNNCNVVVGDSIITGYVWSANYGWINLNPTEGGVMNDGTGNLSGYAWGENIGWINFDDVSVNSSGEFLGYATTSNFGSISFNCINGDICADSNFKVKTTWRSSGSGNTEETVVSVSGGGTYMPPSTPIFSSIVAGLNATPISVSKVNNTLQLTFTGLSNVYQVAISTNPDFSGASWQMYSDIIKNINLSDYTNADYIYVKFRSRQGGETGVYKVLIKNFTVNQQSVANGVTQSKATPKANTSDIDSNYTFKSYLYLGSTGEEVKQLQVLLGKLGYYTHSSVTGYFGNATKQAVIKFQKDKGISPYPGWIGPSTRDVLNSL